MSIDAPPAFIEICRRFHQDIGEVYSTLDDLAAYAVKGIKPADRATVAKFIDDLLSGKYTGGELKALFRRSPSEVYLEDSKHVVALLEAMRQKIGAP